MTTHGESFHILIMMRHNRSWILFWVCKIQPVMIFFCVLFFRRRSTNVSLARCIRPSVASVCPTSARETTPSEWEPRHWPATAPGRTRWISTWPNVRHAPSYVIKLHRSFPLYFYTSFLMGQKWYQVFVRPNRIWKRPLRYDLRPHHHHPRHLPPSHIACGPQQEEVCVPV